jgi:hypothetical protein
MELEENLDGLVYNSDILDTKAQFVQEINKPDFIKSRNSCSVNDNDKRLGERYLQKTHMLKNHHPK